MTDDKEELVISVSFDLRIGLDEYKALVAAAGRDYKTERDKLEENLREDFEDTFGPSEDWKPFKRSGFHIQERRQNG
jgi:hypothetical protein